jgi:peroxiredoxin
VNGSPTPAPPPAPTVRPRLGLAIASLVSGILAFLFSLFVIGIFFGLVGLVLGWVHIGGKRGPNALAWWGMVLSIIGIIASVGLGVVYFRYAKEAFKSFTSSMNSMTQSSNEAEWQGVIAPDVSVTALDGKTVRLSDLKGKRVILDFWATWCGPCVQEIPHFIKLYNETSRDQLEIIGISAEDAGTLKAFVKKKNINYPIASGSGLPVPYKDPTTIPTTFFIDRKGVIQSVVVGYHDFNQLKALALAEDFQGEPKAQPQTPPTDLKDSEKVLTATEVWSNNVPGGDAICAGDWDGDGQFDILLADSAKNLHVFGADGVKKSTISLPEQFSAIECGQSKQKGARLLGHSNGSRKIVAMDVTGKEIWNYKATFGADGAHWGDLDGDGTDEMVIGMNGFGGLHAVSSDGKKLWQAAGGNVWGQAVLSATTNRSAMVFATEAMGSVRIFDGKGQLLRTVRPGGEYCTQLAATVIDKADTIQALALGQEAVVAFDSNGRVAWSAPGSQSAASWVTTKFAAGDVNADGTNEWAFVDGAGDLVLATPSGEKLGAVSKFKGGTGFVFVPDGAKGQLITLSAGMLRAYRFESAP